MFRSSVSLIGVDRENSAAAAVINCCWTLHAAFSMVLLIILYELFWTGWGQSITPQNSDSSARSQPIVRMAKSERRFMEQTDKFPTLICSEVWKDSCWSHLLLLQWNTNSLSSPCLFTSISVTLPWQNLHTNCSAILLLRIVISTVLFPTGTEYTTRSSVIVSLSLVSAGWFIAVLRALHVHPSITVAVLFSMGMEVLAVLSFPVMEVLVRSFNAHRLVTVMLRPDKAKVHPFLSARSFSFAYFILSLLPFPPYYRLIRLFLLLECFAKPCAELINST